MVNRKIYKIIAIIMIFIMVPIQVFGATYWTGKDVYNSNQGKEWGVSQESITKIKTPGRAYDVSDISQYSAHITNNENYIGKTVENAFFWINKSRLAYVKLLKVEGGQDVSFLFDKSIYLYCAEFDKNFVLINDGSWGTDGTRYTLNKNTVWIMIVFRKVNGDLSNGSGNDLELNSSDFSKYNQKYILFSPFIYTLKLNGGEYMKSTEDITMERLGVEKIKLPTPTRKGYIFKGWRSENGNLYSGTLSNTYTEDLFKDSTLTARWSEIKPTEVTFDKEYVILEQNSSESVTLKANILPGDAFDKSITYKSSDENIAKVSRSGKITPGVTGVATITGETFNGLITSCKVYVMGFDISVPTYCVLNKSYTINIKIYNNGKAGMQGRKRVLLDTESTMKVERVGDGNTRYNVVAESKIDTEGEFQSIKGTYLADTMDSQKIYYRLSPKENIKKAGDYEGNVTFTVNVL